ncbi:MAG TPA: amylo-alpha-1,6-glucosidase [Clostridia bacterium]|nr:amylo-alpha-1,6-glucosidase [Clostridia bacterium]
MASYRDGAIVNEDAFFEPNYYDISNNLLTAQFDGRGNISRYSAINKWDFIGSFFNVMTLNGKPLDMYVSKKVTMIGRRQIIEIETEDALLAIKQYADSKTNAIFEEFYITAKKDLIFENVINFEQNIAKCKENASISSLFGTFVSHIHGQKRIEDKDDYLVIRNNTNKRFYFFDIAITKPAKPLGSNKMVYSHFGAKLTLIKGETKKLRIVISAGTAKDFSYFDVAKGYENFDAYADLADEYIAQLPCPKVCDTQFKKAYFNSLYNCAVSMYKERGNFKGFLAGIVYQSPMRTYFRDSYWTSLAVIKYRPELVRRQILTLSKGINKNGKCPSAVRYNFKNWWGDHFDSPSFFAIMLYDYVRTTKDETVLSEKWRGKTILDAAVKVVEKLAENVDETGLLYKSGEFNCRDWCDNVFRNGYCTYDEVLFARALFALGALNKDKPKIASSYMRRYNKVKTAINDILWDTNLGYYVNYKNDNITEDNLSIDTVIAVLFGIADQEKSLSMLKKMETLLESKNNNEQRAGDFGVLSVYPFYKDPKAVVHKSSYPYYYHNGGDWPYFSAIYAYAKLSMGMDYEYPLTRWFDYNIAERNFTPVEFFSPPHEKGSLLQAWSSTGAFVLSYPDGKFFDTEEVK